MALRIPSLPRLLFLALLLVWISANLAHAEGFRFGLNDLSVLVPMPKSEAEAEFMLKPTDRAAGGNLLPAEILVRIPPLVLGGDPAETRNSLRVIAIRFDPCFQEGDEPCRRQIRLVLQPIGVFRRAYSTTDAAVHLFYDFTPGDWAAVMKDWEKTAVGTKADALSVHPTLVAQGLAGAQWAKLRGIVQKHCGPARLSRFTVSNVNLFGTQWTFVGHDIAKDGTITPIKIPRLTTGGQSFVGDLGDLREFFGEVFPPPIEDKELVQIWNHSVGARNTLRPEELAKGVTRAVAFENPKQFHPGNVDCVSCHLAHNTRLWGERSFPNWPWKSMFEKDEYKSGWNLKNTSSKEGFTNRVRAFGYFVDEPVISQRVINETAAVAEIIEAGRAKGEASAGAGR